MSNIFDKSLTMYCTVCDSRTRRLSCGESSGGSCTTMARGRRASSNTSSTTTTWWTLLTTTTHKSRVCSTSSARCSTWRKCAPRQAKHITVSTSEHRTRRIMPDTASSCDLLVFVVLLGGRCLPLCIRLPAQWDVCICIPLIIFEVRQCANPSVTMHTFCY